MKVENTRLSGVKIFTPSVFEDDRGFFLETFRDSFFREVLGDDIRFVQDNHSRSTRGVLRGLHFQTIRPQGKLVRCTRGQVFDVAVDIQPGSPTFGEWVSVILDDKEKKQIYVPPGFAHGFLVMSELADLEYRCTDYYHPEGESGIAWDDPDIGIDWPTKKVQLSGKDRNLPSLESISNSSAAPEV